MTQRLDFVALAKNPSHGHFTQLCRRFGISCKTGYKWLARFESEGADGLKDRSRRPFNHPARTHPKLEKLVLDLRALHPGNGPRKLHRRLLNKGHKKLPAVSTFARILSRHGRIEPVESQKRKKTLRFERSAPNALWQMDFKGHFALGRGGRCQSLTVIDDHSRFLLVLKACRNQRGSTVRNALQAAFALYGLPDCILCDNGSPWGGFPGSYSSLAVWLLRLGVRVIHGRPWHPQTQGKDERFHRTLKHELLCRHDWPDLLVTQQRFDRFKQDYNHERPHEALGMLTPSQRYLISQRLFPKNPPLPTYGSDEITRIVKANGYVCFDKRYYYIGEAFEGYTLALRNLKQPGHYKVCFGSIALGFIDTNHRSDTPAGAHRRMQKLKNIHL